MEHKEIPISKFRNKLEYKMSKLSDEKLERLQKVIIKKLRTDRPSCEEWKYHRTIHELLWWCNDGR